MFAASMLSRRLLFSSSSSSSSCRSVVARHTSSGRSCGNDVSSKLSFAERNPFIFQLGVATAKTSAADVMVQIVVDRRTVRDLDYRRNAIFVVFGFAYLGGFQYWLMATQYAKWFPTRTSFAKLSLADKLKDTAGMKDVARMVTFDIFVHLPFLYFPSYYTCKEIVVGRTWNPIDWITVGCAKYWSNKEEDLWAMIKLWGPVDCIQFSIMPLHYSLPFRHLVSFFWTCYISFTRGGGGGEGGGTKGKIEEEE